MAEALAFSAPAGVAEGLLEHIGLHVMIENMAVRSMGGALVRNMLSEGVQESSQEAAGNFIRWAANKYSGAKIEEADGWKDLIYDSVYAGILGSMTSFPVSVAGSTANRRVSKEAAEAFEQAGMNARDARATAGYLAYNDRVGTMAHALDEARTTGNFDRALAVFTEQAETVENKTGRKFWSTLDRDEQETFMRSLLVPPERFSADAVQIANDMTDPDTYDDPTPEGMAKSFAEGLESYKSETDSRLDALFDEDAEALARAEEKSAQQRKLLERRTDLSDTDKRIIGDMLEAFNASVADKFGAESLQDLEIGVQDALDLSGATEEQLDEFNERAGIYEYENGLTREAAQTKAYKEVFGTDAKQAEAFVETYDEIPFFQNAYDEYVRDFEFDDTGFMREIAALEFPPNKKKSAELKQKYGHPTKTSREAFEYIKALRDRRALRNAPLARENITDRLEKRRAAAELERRNREEINKRMAEYESKRAALPEAKERLAAALSEEVWNDLSDYEKETYARYAVEERLSDVAATANLEYFAKRVLPEMQKAGEVKRVKQSDISGSLYIDGARVSDHSLPGKYDGDDGVILSGKLTGEEMRDAVLQEIEDAKARNSERKQRQSVFYQTGVSEIDESQVYNSLPENLKSAVDFVFAAEPVYSVTGNEFPNDGKSLNEKISDYYENNFGGKVDIEKFGKVLLDKKGIVSSIKHGLSKDKANAFAAVPYVLKNGKIIREQYGYKGKSENRYVFVAPVDLKGEKAFCEVVVKEGVSSDNGGKKRFYIHEVEMIKKLGDVFTERYDTLTSPSSKSILAKMIKENNPAPFYQTSGTVKGAYYPENRVIELFKNADPSTIVHELGHHFTMQYLNLLQENGREAEANGILEWIGAKSIDGITVEQWEKLADAFIVYTKEGFAPSSKLDDLFNALKKYLTTLYEKLVAASGRLPEINDDVREFFDTMLTVDNKTDADFKQMLKQARDLREVVKGVLKGEALEVNGLNVEDVKNLVRALHTRMPRAPKTLEQKIRAAGGIDLDFARALDLVPLMGASEDKFGKSGLFRKNGKFGDEAAIVEFLKGEGYLQDADTAQAVADQWRQAEEVLENASSSYSPADVATLEARENIDAAIRAAQEALAGIDYDALLEGLAAFRSVGAVGASKDVIKYIDNQIKRIQTDAKRLSAKLVKEARRDTERLIRREMKQKAKEERDTLKERQKEIVTFIRSYPIENKNGLISSVQKAFTAKSLSDILEEVRKKAETYYETEKRRRLKSKIESIVKKTKPSSVKNQKFDYDRNVLFKKIREISKYTQIKAAEELAAFAGKEVSEEGLLFEKQPVLLSIKTDNEMKGLDTAAFSEKMLETLYSFRNKSIPNASIGGEIQIRVSSIRKYKSFFADEKKRLIVPYIPELLGKAEFIREDTYTPETESNIIAHWKSDVPVRIDANDYNVRLTVKEDNNGVLFWDAQVKEKAPRTDPTTNSGDKGLTSVNTEDSFKITPFDENVNRGIDAQSAELLMRKFITFKAKGMKASSALMESLLEDLTRMISEGRAAKEEADFERRKDLAIQKNAVRRLIVERSQKAGADLWLRVSFTCYFRPQSHTKGGCGFMRKKRFVYAPEWISGSLK